MVADPPTPEEFEEERESEENADTDDTMSQDKNADTTEASGIRAEITTIRGTGALENMTLTHSGGNKWTVLSARSGSVDAYRVDITEPSCTCEHSEQKGHTTEACGHIIYTLLEGERTVPEEAYQAARIHEAVDKLRDVSGEVEALHAAMDETRVEQLSNGPVDSPDNTDATADPPTAEEAYEGTARGEAMENAKSPEEAAEELQAAFDDVIDDMEVEVYEGNVWFKTGYNTPDDLPIMGKPDTWETLIKNPDVQTYEPDDGPGKYFKNYLKPNQVETYISEVLE